MRARGGTRSLIIVGIYPMAEYVTGLWCTGLGKYGYRTSRRRYDLYMPSTNSNIHEMRFVQLITGALRRETHLYDENACICSRSHATTHTVGFQVHILDYQSVTHTNMTRSTSLGVQISSRQNFLREEKILFPHKHIMERRRCSPASGMMQHH